MSLYPCPACSQKVSVEAANCPHCGQPLDTPTAVAAKTKYLETVEEARKAEADRQKLKRRVGWGILAVLAFLFIRAMGKSTAPSGIDTTTGAATAPEPKPSIPYITVDSWPNIRRDPATGRLYSIGYGRVLFVDSSYRTEEALERLGDQLHRDVPRDQQLHFEVFSDSLSATRRQKGIASELPAAQQRRFDRHFIGSYNKNPASGSESWVFGTNGVPNEPSFEVEYKAGGSKEKKQITP